jgi:hypothetical protein
LVRGKYGLLGVWKSIDPTLPLIVYSGPGADPSGSEAAAPGGRSLRAGSGRTGVAARGRGDGRRAAGAAAGAAPDTDVGGADRGDAAAPGRAGADAAAEARRASVAAGGAGTEADIAGRPGASPFEPESAAPGSCAWLAARPIDGAAPGAATCEAAGALLAVEDELGVEDRPDAGEPCAGSRQSEPASAGRGFGQPVPTSACAAQRDRTTHAPIASNTASTSQRPRRLRRSSTFSAIASLLHRMRTKGKGSAHGPRHAAPHRTDASPFVQRFAIGT